MRASLALLILVAVTTAPAAAQSAHWIRDEHNALPRIVTRHSQQRRSPDVPSC